MAAGVNAAKSVPLSYYQATTSSKMLFIIKHRERLSDEIAIQTRQPGHKTQRWQYS